MGEKEPWIFDPDRRAVLQAELDAIFTHLYGLNTEELRYILYPEDVCGVWCINETFRVLRDNEIREFGEYRTKRLVLEAWERLGYCLVPLKVAAAIIPHLKEWAFPQLIVKFQLSVVSQ